MIRDGGARFPASATDTRLGVCAALAESMIDAVWLVDATSLRIVAANTAAGALLGTGAHDLIGRGALELAATPEDLCFWAEAVDGVTEGIESETFVSRFDGSTLPVLRRVRRIDDGHGPLYVVALRDRSAQQRIERALEDSSAELAATLESTADGILVTDLSGRVRHCNQRFASMWGVPPELLFKRDDDALIDWMRRSVTDPGAYMRRLADIDEATMLHATDVLRLHSGRVIERVTLPQCSRGRPIGRVYSFRDISERVEAGERIELLSHHDPLTGLANRRRLSDRLALALAMAQRDGTCFGVLHINLDRFKHINDTLGQAVGDQVLVDAARRLGGCVRQVDTLARLGGDEFVLIAHQADAGGAEAAAQRLSEALTQPFTLGGLSFTVTASIGIALYPKHGTSVDELVRHADAAMHEVKVAGRAGWRFHQDRRVPTDGDARSRLLLDHAMRQGLPQQRFRLHYQPQIDLASGEVIGAEALLRWRDPALGEVSPGVFIPVAEESGFIIALGEWVLHRAAEQAAAWHARGLSLCVALNVSALQFRQAGFVEGVARVLHSTGLPGHLLELELTESILIQDAEDTLSRLHELARLGVKMAIDDFGTGYSSLGYLKRLPIDRLKIDRSFVDGLPGDASDAGIVNAIVSFGRALQLKVIAEGVETEAQRAFLEAAGCDEFQGFLVSPALEPAAFEAMLGGFAPGRASLRRVK